MDILDDYWYLQITLYMVGTTLTASIHRDDKPKRTKKTRYYSVTRSSYTRLSRIANYKGFKPRLWLSELGWDATKIIKK